MTTTPKKKIDIALTAVARAFRDLGCDVGPVEALLFALQPHIVANFNKHFTLPDAGAAAKELKPAISKANKLVAFAEALSLPVAANASDQLANFKRKVEELSRRKAMNLSEDDVLPAEFKCPITHEKMTDPVTASDGHNYERSALEEHFRVSGRISPLTRAHISAWFPNIDLRNRIQAHEGELLKLMEKAKSSRAGFFKKPKAAQPSPAKKRKAHAETAGKKRAAPSESLSSPVRKTKCAKSAKPSKERAKSAKSARCDDDSDGDWMEGDP